jgi:hypothetical protein
MDKGRSGDSRSILLHTLHGYTETARPSAAGPIPEYSFNEMSASLVRQIEADCLFAAPFQPPPSK